ncbi:MAG TPA: sulfotransferase [Chloroflexota bacterium]|nr:sulfotransferase [Chloroflexota bacterium]
MEVSDRALGPTFVIAGAARSGTTALYQALRHHPEVFMTSVKEPNYFAALTPSFPHAGAGSRPAYMTSLAGYLGLFACSESFKARGEVSPAYLYYPGTAGEIKRSFPECRVAIVLRNPVDRAVSHYRALTNIGRERRSFEVAFRASMEGREQGFAWKDYAGTGLYADRIAEYLNTFGRDRVRVWTFDTLQTQPADVLAELCGLIGVAPLDPASISRRWNSSEADVLRLLAPLRRHRPLLAQTVEILIREKLPAPASQVVRTLLLSHPVRVPASSLDAVHQFYRQDVLRLRTLLPDLDLSAWV